MRSLISNFLKNMDELDNTPLDEEEVDAIGDTDADLDLGDDTAEDDTI